MTSAASNTNLPVASDGARPAVRTGIRRGLGVGWIGLAIMVALLLVSFGSLPWTFATVTAPGAPPARRYDAGNIDLSLLPPLWLGTRQLDVDRIAAARQESQYVPGRLLGTDRQGRDVFARCLAGGAISLTVGLSAAALAVLIGTAYGAFSGYRGGRVDAILMRIVDILFGLPSILLVVLLAVAVNGRIERLGTDIPAWLRQGIELVTLLVAIGGVSWLTMARVIRGQVLSLKQQPFLEAARAMGLSPTQQFRVHLLPNLVGPIAVYATLAVPAAILSESFLSFLGIGIRDPLPSWGNLAADGLTELNTVASRWWLLVAPCALIAMSLISLNFLGDSLRERLDPARGKA
ncbi:MAG: ABC transporter permease [Phycisphaerae bacterium]|nr:ABC transporter permease [Phycisphaerae bacterium]